MGLPISYSDLGEILGDFWYLDGSQQVVQGYDGGVIPPPFRDRGAQHSLRLYEIFSLREIG